MSNPNQSEANAMPVMATPRPGRPAQRLRFVADRYYQWSVVTQSGTPTQVPAGITKFHAKRLSEASP